MAKLTDARIRVLRAAAYGHLCHGVYGDYDWTDLSDVTGDARTLLDADFIELAPLRLGDEHYGQKYRLTGAGKKVLAELDAKE